MVDVFLPELRRRGEGHIVLTAGGAGLHPTPPALRIGAYGAVKHAVVGYARNLRAELDGSGVAVTLLCPTAVHGDLASTSAESHRRAVGTAGDVGGHQPVGRVLDDGSVLGPVVVEALRDRRFLASNRLDDLRVAIDIDRRRLKG